MKLTIEQLKYLQAHKTDMVGSDLVSMSGADLLETALSLAEENTRLREALEWYAEPSIYQQEYFEGTGMEYPALVDGGHSARLALAPEAQP